MKLPIKYRALGYAAAAVGAACIGFYFGAPSGDGVRKICRRTDGSPFPCDAEDAFFGAAKRGACGIKTALRLTADGEIVCAGDDAVVFADGGAAKVSECAFSQLKDRPLAGTAGMPAAPLCTFRRCLELCRESGLFCFFELMGAWEEAQLSACIGLVSEVYALSMCEVQSASFETLTRARALEPALRGMLLAPAADERLLRRCIEGGLDLGVPALAVSRRKVREFRRRGQRVLLLSANDPLTLLWCRWMEPDDIESDVD